MDKPVRRIQLKLPFAHTKSKCEPWILLKQKAGVSEKVMQVGEPHIERDCTSFQRNPIGLCKGEIQTIDRRLRRWND